MREREEDDSLEDTAMENFMNYRLDKAGRVNENFQDMQEKKKIICIARQKSRKMLGGK